MRGIPNSGSLKKIGQNERLGVPSTKWLSLTPERFPHHTRPTFTRSTLLRGLAPHNISPGSVPVYVGYRVDCMANGEKCRGKAIR